MVKKEKQDLNNEPKEKRQIKFLLLGLDNAGKTSIYLSLTRETNLSNFCQVNPTRDFVVRKIETANESYSIWDLGGQEKVRQQNIELLPEHLKKTDKIIYVIDIQDHARFEKSLQFMQSIVDIMKKEQIMVPFLVFLHKYDRDFDKIRSSNLDKIDSDLLPKIDAILSDLYHEKFKTAIVPVFRKERVI